MAAGFTLADAVTLERVQLEGESLLQPVDSLFRAHPAYHIRTERAEALCRNGNPLAPPDAPADGLYRVYGRDGTFLCLSRAQNGTLTSLKNFSEREALESYCHCPGLFRRRTPRPRGAFEQDRRARP